MLKDYRLLPPAILIWINTIVILSPPFFILQTHCKFIVFPIESLILFIFRKSFNYLYCLNIILICFIFISISIRSPYAHNEGIINNKTTTLETFKITSSPTIQQSFGEEIYNFQAISQNNTGTHTLTLKTKSDQWEYGATYKAEGKYNHDDFHFSNLGIFTLFEKHHLSENYPKNLLVKQPNLINKISNKLRHNFIITLQDPKNNFSDSTKALISGMSIGDTRFVPKELKNNFKISGLTHLTAISGAHFSIILSILILIINLFKIPKSISIALQFLSIFLITFLVHPTDSVKRTLVMNFIALLGLTLKRKSQSISALSAVTIFYITTDPAITLSLGFALSCLATAGIILFSPKLQSFLSTFFPDLISELIAISLSAGFLTAPIVAKISGYIPFWTVLANILVTPFVPLSTLFSFLAVIFSPIPSLSVFFIKIGSLGTIAIAGIANFISTLPLACFSTKLTFYIAIPLLILGLIIKFLKHSKYFKPLTRLKKYLIITIISLILTPFFILNYGKNQLGWFNNIPDNWIIANCDVGQGDAAAIKSGEHSAIIIDTGPKDTTSGGIGIDKCLRELNIRTIDLLITSHQHLDHIGGKQNATQNRKVENELNIQNSYTNQKGSINNIQWEILDSNKNATNENNKSLAILFTITLTNNNTFTYFTAGDQEKDESITTLENLKQRQIQNIDYLKVNHHGSKNQLPELLNWLNPKVAILSVGKNTFGHPAQKTINKLQMLNSEILRTDQNGTCGICLVNDKIMTFKTRL
ncbi:MAG: ComEC/Rec2 family competence protein [Candidatus Ancillula sp.]|jgi:competence protein ComEC|nr:ComEC/Rec2 family competence protein [Candidatus Ancillula sp.]